MLHHDREITRILGVDFFRGTAKQAVELMQHGGLLVVPAAPALKEMEHDSEYRDALLNADVAITDSAFMVMIWNFLQEDTLERVSGLEYLHDLLQTESVRRPGNAVWVMAGPENACRNLAWLSEQGIRVPSECVYHAPMYGKPLEDEELVALLERIRPQHVMVTVGGGTQERLGLYLKRQLNYLPAIHCTGAAIAFLSGDQVHIPLWADNLYLGWFFRCLSEPKRYVPRYWAARKLFSLMRRYRDRLPVAA